MKRGLSKDRRVQHTGVTNRMTLRKTISVYFKDTFFPFFSASFLGHTSSNSFSSKRSLQLSRHWWGTENVVAQKSNFLDYLFLKSHVGLQRSSHHARNSSHELDTNLLRSLSQASELHFRKNSYFTEAHSPRVVLNSLETNQCWCFFNLRDITFQLPFVSPRDIVFTSDKLCKNLHH